MVESLRSSLRKRYLKWTDHIIKEADLMMLVGFLFVLLIVHLYMPSDQLVVRLMETGFGAFLIAFRRTHNGGA